MGKVKSVHTTARSGRYVKALPVREGERYFDVAVDSTLRAALIRPDNSPPQKSFSVDPSDLRKKIFKRPRKSLIVFVVDASDSMGEGTFARMKAAKGAALAILAKARLKRHRIAMVAFWGESAEVVLQPTSSLALARKRLKSLHIGGATPFADGLMKAWAVVKTERLKDPDIKPLLVIISDGEANVPYGDKQKFMQVPAELALIGRRIAQDHIYSIVIDTKLPWEKSDDMRRVAETLGGTYHRISRLKARNVVEFVSAF
jgi:magnesium chelatase subunit D